MGEGLVITDWCINPGWQDPPDGGLSRGLTLQINLQLSRKLMTFTVLLSTRQRVDYSKV